SAAEAEDAAQDAMIKAYVALPRFRDGAPFRPWLLTIVANEARNRRKATARHPALSLDAAAVRPAVSGTDPPETAAIVRAHDDTLIRAVNGLGGDDRRVIAFRYFLDLSEAEMAEALGVARGTVKSRLSRALGRVRALLAAEGGGDV
ncbi:MAG: RNA polymerase sigma factor, partial [Thermomicrobiales bacterium]